MRDFYQRNELIAGRVRLRCHRIDLSDVRSALLNISGRWDHIVSPSQTAATTKVVGSPDVTSITRDAGHVGILAGPSAMTSLWPASVTGSKHGRNERGCRRVTGSHRCPAAQREVAAAAR